MAFWATLAANVGSRLLGAGGRASQNRAQMSSNSAQIKNLRQSLDSLEELTSASVEGAQIEQQETFENIGKKLSDVTTDLYKRREDAGTGGFAVNMQVEEQFAEGARKMAEDFSDKVMESNKNLDKMIAGIESEEKQRRSSILGQIQVLQAQNKQLGKRKKWWQNIF